MAESPRVIGHYDGSRVVGVHYILDSNRYPDPISLTKISYSLCQNSLIIPRANDLLHREGMDDLRTIKSGRNTRKPGS